MRRAGVFFGVVVLMTGCASAPTQDPMQQTNQAQLMQVGYVTQTAPAPSASLCEPTVVGESAALNANCLNVVERSPAAGKQIVATGREIKHQGRDLCNNMVLPKCRRKY